MVERCAWVGDDPLMVEYHDTEWGVPLHDDRKFFEYLTLDGAQAGLSWRNILHKREGYRRAFADYDVNAIAGFPEERIAELLLDPGIVRNRQKVRSVVSNAEAFLRVQEEFGSFDAYVWRFVEGRPLRNRWQESRDVPAKTPESEALSRDLMARGFKFVGPTICYAFMQGAGLVNDHLITCFRFDDPGAA